MDEGDWDMMTEFVHQALHGPSIWNQRGRGAGTSNNTSQREVKKKIKRMIADNNARNYLKRAIEEFENENNT